MSELRKIAICQSLMCQDKGAKHVLRAFEKLLDGPEYSDRYPDLVVSTEDCPGECEFGPIVSVNGAVTLRDFLPEQAEPLLKNPEHVLGEVIHVLDKDRDTFQRIIEGGLY